MNPKAKEALIVFVLIIVGFYFLINGLVESVSFLAPLSIAVLLSMVLIPLSHKLERNGMSRGLSSLTSVLITMVAFAGLFTVLSLQVNSIAEDWPKIKKNLEPKINQFQKFIHKNTGIPLEKQEELIGDYIPGSQKQNSQNSRAADSTQTGNPQSPSITKGNNQNSSDEAHTNSSSKSKLFGFVGTAFIKFINFMATSLLVFIYIFFMLFYRRKIRLSILNFFKGKNKHEAETIISESINVSQGYLIGRLLLILFLAVIYSIGLSVSGVKSAILISIIAALLSLIPYVGNIIGYVLAMAMAAFTGADAVGFLGVTITFVIAQFVESYILEPYIVGKKVDLNPIITIIVVVLGGAVWGVTGMIISIPVFAILKIIFDHIPVLNPLGYLLGEEDISSNNKENVFSKAAKKIKNKFE